MHGVDGHGDGAVGGHGHGEGILVPLGDVHESRVGGAHGRPLELAGVLVGRVGVALLGVQAVVVADVLKEGGSVLQYGLDSITPHN